MARKHDLRRAGAPSAVSRALAGPAQVAKTPPCIAGCAAGGDVRGWIGVVAQRRKLGLSDAEAYARAWSMIAAVNPFPATLGRVCPHPCESRCNRKDKDGAVAINALERFLGDWGLRNGLELPREIGDAQPESIGVIGAGPAGLSFAYQMARRGYRVTIYEKRDTPGGMLYHGIPQYRLPEDVLDAEIRRVLALGVELELGVAVGRHVTVDELRRRHAAVFVGIGADRGLSLGIPGEEGPGVLTGVGYLGALNCGEPVAVGAEVVVIGGGNTAMDAARSARRAGARVTVLYRRTQAEMPAIAGEIRAAQEEGVAFECLAAPLAIERSGGTVTGVVAQRMRPGERDASGRHRSVPIEGSEFRVAADTVITAVAQAADWGGLDVLERLLARGEATARAMPVHGIAAGGDALGPGIAGMAIAQGRRAAEAMHAKLRSLPDPAASSSAEAPMPEVKADYYAPRERVRLPSLPIAERLARPDAEVEATLTAEAFSAEVERCFSCGLCFGCEHCFTYCNAGGFVRLAEPKHGAYFALTLDACEACRKCVEVCPCGFLSVVPRGTDAGPPAG
jgi:NADPH-dependent glutamate synthase beta subunit-like oxidoreductase